MKRRVFISSMTLASVALQIDMDPRYRHVFQRFETEEEIAVPLRLQQDHPRVAGGSVIADPVFPSTQDLDAAREGWADAWGTEPAGASLISFLPAPMPDLR